MGDSSDSEFENENESGADAITPGPVPKPIRSTKGTFADLSFHPSSYLLATVNIEGFLQAYECVPEEKCKQKIKLRSSKKPCRGVSFSEDGQEILTISKDKTLRVVDTNTGNIQRILHETHSSAPYCLCVVNKNILATGDEDGEMKLWDLRKEGGEVLREKRFDDYVSEIAVDDERRLIFAVSGDGVMTSYNARQRKFLVESEGWECDLMCAQVVKNNKKLIVGTADGSLNLFNWDQFAAPSDHFPVHSDAVNSIARVSDNVVCTACMDGKIRALHILPNRLLKVVGTHNGLPVEKIKTTFDGKLLASCSHDSIVKFWDVGHVTSIRVSEHEKANKAWKADKRRGGKKRRTVDDKNPDFFCDFGGELSVPPTASHSSSDDDDSDDDDPETT